MARKTKSAMTTSDPIPAVDDVRQVGVTVKTRGNDRKWITGPMDIPNDQPAQTAPDSPED